MSMPEVFLAAAEVTAPPPTPAPGGTHLPGVSEAMIKLAETTILGTLLVIAIGAIVTLWLYGNARQKRHEEAMAALAKAHDEDRTAWAQQLNGLQEQRLLLLERVVTGLSNASASMAQQSQATAERTQSAKQLGEEIRALASTQAESRAFFRSVAEQLTKQGETNTRSLERLSYAIKAPPA